MRYLLVIIVPSEKEESSNR